MSWETAYWRADTTPEEQEISLGKLLVWDASRPSLDHRDSELLGIPK